MLTKEEFSVRAPIQDVWDFMLDPEKLGSCIPGFEGIEPIGENAYKSTIRIRLPIFSITVESTTTVTEAIPLRRLKSITEGRYDLTGRQILVYVSNLSAGNPLTFSFRLRAKYPLTAQTPASNAYDYYNPDISGESTPLLLVVNP